MEIIEITEDNYLNEVVNSKGLVLIDFNATWCGPCRMLSPVLEELSKTRDDCKIVSIDVDVNESVAAAYGILSIPCLVLLKDGKEERRVVGFRSLDEINEFIGE